MNFSSNERNRDAFIGFGSNLGDPVSNIEKALRMLTDGPDVSIGRVSSLYRTAPVGVEDQDWFVNGVARIRTVLEPLDLLDRLLSVEKILGRVRTLRWGPRTVDLDILLYKQTVLDIEKLQIPHPRMHERRFVLVPLCEIAPDVMHPVFRKTMLQLSEEIKDDKAVELMEGLEEWKWDGSVGRP